jgi:outer membrane protein assembly factor BamB
MAGANPQRTSWTSENIPGNLAAEWVKPIAPHIQQKVQLIAAEDKIFVSTARGLYAFDAATGTQVWIYPTELPLGNSPTYKDGVLYVGGFDRQLYAINATIVRIWAYSG